MGKAGVVGVACRSFSRMLTEKFSPATVATLRQAAERNELIFEESWQLEPGTLTLPVADLRTLVIDRFLFPETIGQRTGYRPTDLLRSALDRANQS